MGRGDGVDRTAGFCGATETKVEQKWESQWREGYWMVQGSEDCHGEQGEEDHVCFCDSGWSWSYGE